MGLGYRAQVETGTPVQHYFPSQIGVIVIVLAVLVASWSAASFRLRKFDSLCALPGVVLVAPGGGPAPAGTGRDGKHFQRELSTTFAHACRTASWCARFWYRTAGGELVSFALHALVSRWLRRTALQCLSWCDLTVLFPSSSLAVLAM